MAGGVMMDIDMSDLQRKIERMRAMHTQKEFERMMARVYRRMPGRVRAILRREVPQDYHARGGWLQSSIGAARFNGGTGCVIPVNNVRGIIGSGGEFKASAVSAGAVKIRSAYTRKRTRKGNKVSSIRRKYKINAMIATGAASQLPSAEGQPGGVHFMVFRGQNAGKVYTRLPGRKRVRRAVGIGVPQMPTNRSREAVQRDVIEALEKRIEAEHNALFRGYAK